MLGGLAAEISGMGKRDKQKEYTLHAAKMQQVLC